MFQVLGLLILLVALPAGSWFYLSKGLNYRLRALEELGNHGGIGDFQLATAGGDTLGRAGIAGRIVVASFFSPSDEALRRRYHEQLSRLHRQFDDGQEVLFLQHLPLDSALALARASELQREYGLDDPEQVYFLTGGSPPLEVLARDVYRLPAPELAPAENPHLVLADSTLTIRRYYDARQLPEFKRLVEHIAMMLPPQKRKNLVFQREQER